MPCSVAEKGQKTILLLQTLQNHHSDPLKISYRVYIGIRAQLCFPRGPMLMLINFWTTTFLEHWPNFAFTYKFLSNMKGTSPNGYGFC